MQKKFQLVSLICILFVVSQLGGCMSTPSKPAAVASKYPEKPINMIVAFSPGSGTDVTARTMEKLAPKYLGQPLVITNKTGAAGTLGWNELAAATPDGYTVGIVAIDMLLLTQYGSGKYNYLTALSPIAQVSALPMVLAVHAEQPWQNLDDLIAQAKKNPGKLKFAHAGLGTFAHVLGEMLSREAGISIEQVPFSGGSEAVGALLGGHVQFLIGNPVVIKEHVRTGTIRVLATTSEQRIDDPVFAQVPTFKEQGLDITLTNWFAVASPKEIPPDIKNKLSEGFKAIITDPEFTTNMNNLGIKVQYQGPQETVNKWLTDNQKLTVKILV